MNIFRKLITYIKKRRVVAKVNKALKINLTKWQIAFIFDGIPIPAEIENERCNGKTLAHILRLCLKTNNPENINLFELTRCGDWHVSRFAYGADGEYISRIRFFEQWLRDIYIILSKTKGLKIRDMRMRMNRGFSSSLYVMGNV